MKNRIKTITLILTGIIITILLITFFKNKSIDNKTANLIEQINSIERKITNNQELINELSREIDLDKIESLEKENELWKTQLSIINPYLE